VAGFRVARTLHRLLAAEVADELVAKPKPDDEKTPRKRQAKEAA
jgi:hypothetical protein